MQTQCHAFLTAVQAPLIVRGRIATAFRNEIRILRFGRRSDERPARGSTPWAGDRFIDAVLWEGDGTFKTLMTAPYSFINSILAKLYRVADHGNGDALVKTTLDPEQRAGLLTQPAVMAAHSKSGESFPILRGKFIHVGLLCQSLPVSSKIRS